MKEIFGFTIYIINYSFLMYYFNSILSSKRYQSHTFKAIFSFILLSIIYLFVTGDFFKGYSSFTITVGTVLVLISILLFFFRLLKTDNIIHLKKYLPIYLSIGVLFFNLCVTPLEVFSQYFKAVNELYVNIRTNVMLITNIFMYSTFITGFIICAKSSPNKDELLN